MTKGFIQLIITTKDISNKVNNNICCIDGINNIINAIAQLSFSGNETLYVHLKEAIEPKELNSILNNLCKTIINKDIVNWAEYQQIGIPENGAEHIVSFDANNKIKENRFVISFIKA